jgi:hypothetical protein
MLTITKREPDDVPLDGARSASASTPSKGFADASAQLR